MTAFHEHLDRFVQRLIDFDRRDVRARHHDLARQRLAELQDRVDHLFLVVFNRAALLPDIDQRHDLFFGDGFADVFAARDARRACG